MDYRAFLSRREDVVAPYLGGREITTLTNRSLRLSAPLTPGWYRFEINGKSAEAKERVDPPPLDALPGEQGHLARSRELLLVTQDARTHPISLPPEDEPPALSRCLARRWPSGELLFERLDFDTEAEEDTRRALEELESLHGKKGLPASLRAAFAYTLAAGFSQELSLPASPLELRGRIGEIADGGRDAAVSILRALDVERRAAAAEAARRRALVRPPSPGPIPRSRIPESRGTHDRIQSALQAAGARLLSERSLAGGQVEVIYRFQDERFVAIVERETLQVVDAGICLDGADELLTLESLPGVVREAIDTGRLVITCHAGDEY